MENEKGFKKFIVKLNLPNIDKMERAVELPERILTYYNKKSVNIIKTEDSRVSR